MFLVTKSSQQKNSQRTQTLLFLSKKHFQCKVVSLLWQIQKTFSKSHTWTFKTQRHISSWTELPKKDSLVGCDEQSCIFYALQQYKNNVNVAWWFRLEDNKSIIWIRENECKMYFDILLIHCVIWMNNIMKIIDFLVRC
jgi:hypothetical protein